MQETRFAEQFDSGGGQEEICVAQIIFFQVRGLTKQNSHLHTLWPGTLNLGVAIRHSPKRGGNSAISMQ